MKIRVPLQPVIDHINSKGGDFAAAFFEQEEFENPHTGEAGIRISPDCLPTYNLHRNRITNAIERGWLDYFHADELCIDVFQLHPALVFGMRWWDYPEDKALQDRLAGREEQAA